MHDIVTIDDKNHITDAFTNIENTDLNCANLTNTVSKVIAKLDSGQLRVAEKINQQWQVNTFVKQAVLLYMYAKQAETFDANYINYFDKIPQKFFNKSVSEFEAVGVRVVPPAHVRYGSFIGQKTVLMPSFVNIGAYVGSGCMIDTWASVGSCAQIGNNVHISGGAGIGGVLEPIQANPTIIEDNCFIGARSEIVEGVVVEANSVISMGVFIGKSTKIYNRMTKEISYGKVPSGSVVVPGSLPSEDGSHSIAAAIIVKQIDAQTRKKVSINELLRY